MNSKRIKKIKKAKIGYLKSIIILMLMILFVIIFEFKVKGDFKGIVNDKKNGCKIKEKDGR